MNAWVYAVNDWGHTPSPNLAAINNFGQLGGVSAPLIGDGLFMTVYTGGTTSPGITYSTSALPDNAILKFPQDISVERVIVWSGPCWQEMPGLYDFDVDTLESDGTTWTTRETVSRTAPSSDWFGDAYGLGSQRETYWNEQWVEDVKLSSPVTTKGIRIHVRGASYGGAPDADMVNFTGKELDANAMPVPKLAIQDIAVISPTPFVLPDAYRTVVLADSPNGVWPLDELSGSAAASLVNSGTMDGTYVNGLLHGFAGVVSGEGTASGNENTTGQVTVTDTALLNVADVFTLECWYKPIANFAGQFRGLMGHGVHHFNFGVNTTGHVYLERFNTGTIIATSVDSLSVGVWAHIVCTKDGADTKIYINGVEGTTLGTDVTFGVNPANLGILGESENYAQWAALYPTALDAARILAHYQSGTAPSVPVLSVPPTVET